MGILASRQLFGTKHLVESISKVFAGRKRKREESDDEEQCGKVIDLVMHTPKKIRLVTTPQYIYQMLFLEGKNSDVTVEVLGHRFHLHKIYLSQSPYFASMFGGSWMESNWSHVSIDVVDSQITLDSIKIVLGSLYNNEISINPSEVIPILACAIMFQLDSLIDKCREVMIETINPTTAMNYNNAAAQFGDKKLLDKCQTWFLTNLMTYYYYGSLSSLRDFPIELMRSLVAHPNLFVVQTEFSLYTMLKFWLYANLNPDLNERTTLKLIHDYFSKRSNATPFLLTEEGTMYAPVFEGLRMHNLLSHHIDVEMIHRDNIIPRDWLCKVFVNQWKVMLRVNQNEDKGPSEDLDANAFLWKSLRCGRVLAEKDRHLWRWTGFHYGMDLLMMTDGYLLSIKRNHRPEFEQLLSFQNSRQLAIRVTVANLNEQRQVTFFQTTGIKHVSLAKGEEIKLMTFDKPVAFPLIISANILFTELDSTTQAPPVEAPECPTPTT